jgi:hypothetical protein
MKFCYRKNWFVNGCVSRILDLKAFQANLYARVNVYTETGADISILINFSNSYNEKNTCLVTHTVVLCT